jgi:phthalate 4,5-dioxygenase
VMPWWSFIPGAPGQGVVCCSIPMDDEWTSQWYIQFNAHQPLPTGRNAMFGQDSGDPDDFTSDMGDVTNMWQQDRKAMKDGHWSGIVGKTNAYEDFIVQESMGPIVDRSQEHLGQADLVIVRARKILIDAVREFQRTSRAPFVDGVDFARIRALAIMFPKDKDWKTFDPFRPETLAAAE